MEIDELTAPDEQEQTPRPGRRQLAQQAITLAMQSRWDEAVETNRQIVDMGQPDAETCNRLGKALKELGRIAEAREAYEQALQVDPANAIATRSLDQLSRISDAEAAELAKRAGQKLDPQFFTEETGKTGVTALHAVARPEVLATVSAGDRVTLERQNGALMVSTVDGVRLGQVEDALATRLTRLMQTGNEYQAGVVGLDGHTLRVIIRETFQAPQNSGRISFPPRTETLPRPYLREGLMRRGAEEEDEEELDVDLQDDLGEEEEEDAAEFGFHEGGLDES
jgi:tetratricopeptide (TPR) repeat protein